MANRNGRALGDRDVISYENTSVEIAVPSLCCQAVASKERWIQRARGET